MRIFILIFLSVVLAPALRSNWATGSVDSAIALAKANGMAPGKLLGIMADNSEEFARFGKKDR